jgi:hypothetical protein
MKKPPVDLVKHGVGQTVAVGKSNTPRAGKGLFAMRDFQRNEFITFYDGTLVDRKTALELRRTGHDTHVRCIYFLGDCINGYNGKNIQYGHGGASIANDLFNANNCRLENSLDNKVWLRANRDIEKHEELGYSYGKQYWARSSSTPVVVSHGGRN